MPRFVILRHNTPPGSSRPLHWDFMLERDGVLWTWALPEEPSPGREQTAEVLANHRLAYLDYEGAISENRGWVSRWDRGTYETLRWDVVAPRGAEVHVVLDGDEFCGEVVLLRMKAQPNQWRFLWKGN